MRPCISIVGAAALLALTSPVRAEEAMHHEVQFDLRGRGADTSNDPFAIHYQLVMPLFDGRGPAAAGALHVETDYAVVGIGPAWHVTHETSGDVFELALTPLIGSYRPADRFIARLEASAAFYASRASGRVAVSGPLFGGGVGRPGLHYDGDILLWPFPNAGWGLRTSSESGTGPMLAAGFPATRIGRGWLSVSWLPLPSGSHGVALDARRWLVNLTLVH